MVEQQKLTRSATGWPSFTLIACHLSVLWLLSASLASAVTVSVRSGNGTIGGRDDAVTFLLGPSTGDFSHPFTLADFSNAQSGPAAFILTRNASWLPGLSVDSSAKWIGTNANAQNSGNTALYAASFMLPNAVKDATFVLHYAADDTLAFTGGFGGILLNGTAICTNLIEVGFGSEHTLTCNNVGSLLHVGTNWLYFYAVNGSGPAGLLFSATITSTDVFSPSIDPGGIVSAASTALHTVAAGSIASVYGGFPVDAPSQAPGGAWPVSLSGASIQFGGVQAPLYYVSGSLVDLQVPWELAGQTQASVSATVKGQMSGAQTATITPFAPGIFSMNGQGTGQGAITDVAGHLVDPTNPATPGSYIVIYCTGLGAVTNQPPTGTPAPINLLAPTTTTPSVAIGDVPVVASWSGLAPLSVGEYVAVAQVPTGVNGNAVTVVISMGGMTSNAVTIAVQAPNPQPTVTSLSPSSVPAGSGPLTLTINGTGFTANSSVTFNSVPHTVSFVNTTQLTISLSVSDISTAGSFPVVVSNPAPAGGSSNAVSFAVTAGLNPQPSITSLSPTSAFAGQSAQTLRINGSGFISASSATFNGVPHRVAFTDGGPLTITLSAADLASAGNFPVMVTNPSPGGGVSNTVYFSVVAPINLSGAWQGTWSSTLRFNGSLSATFSQTGSSLAGTMSMANSRCFTSGTLTTGSTISGAAIVLHVAFSSGLQIVVSDGQTNGRGQIIGDYSVQGGSCPDGNAGGITLTKN